MNLNYLIFLNVLTMVDTFNFMNVSTLKENDICPHRTLQFQEIVHKLPKSLIRFMIFMYFMVIILLYRYNDNHMLFAWRSKLNIIQLNSYKFIRICAFG